MFKTNKRQGKFTTIVISLQKILKAMKYGAGEERHEIIYFVEETHQQRRAWKESTMSDTANKETLNTNRRKREQMPISSKPEHHIKNS